MTSRSLPWSLGDTARRVIGPRVASLLALVWLLSGCGEGFDPANELSSLRVLGVTKDQPYVQPGEHVTLDLLFFDGSDEAPRSVYLLWLPPCFNPPGDLYYGCFAQFADPESLTTLPDLQLFQDGPHGVSRTSFDVPDDLLAERPNPAPGQPRYGTALSFFALCASDWDPLPPLGPFEFLAGGGGEALPLVCRGGDGKLVGPDDFVAGYTTLYSFAPTDGDVLRNGNPIVTGFEIDGHEILALDEDGEDNPALCLNADCREQPPELVGCDQSGCIEACDDDGESDCPEIHVRPIVDRSSAERDDVANLYYDRNAGEQMWINYYVDRGGLESPVRLLNDATVGWNEDYGTQLYAPREPGPLSLWAVVHDNRGGTSWVRASLLVE